MAHGSRAQAVAGQPPPLLLLEALSTLRDRVAALRFPLELPGVATARTEQSALVGQVDDYLLPRLRQLDAPLLVVVGGSTGAGKSTLVNTLVGARVSAAGVLRPTTRAPVLVCAQEDVGWFADDRVLPGMSRTTGDAADARSLRLVPSAALRPGLALLDAPDIDSVVAANRELAAQLLSAADLWLFVTTAARYADAVPWDMLHTAAARSTALAVVLDRVPPEALAEVTADLRGMLAANGLADAAVFPVPETVLADGALPTEAVAPVRSWLDDLTADADSRAAVIRSTLTGALAALSRRVPVLADQADAQYAGVDALREQVAGAYELAVTDVEDAVRDGRLLRGEVLARWQEFVGTGELMRTLETRIGQLRDRLWAAVSGRPVGAAPVHNALENSIEDLVVDAADRAAERSLASWRASPGSRRLLAARAGPPHRAGSAVTVTDLPDGKLSGAERSGGEPLRAEPSGAEPSGGESSGGESVSLGRSSPGLRERLAEEIRDWQGGVLDLVAAEGADKRTAARVASLGVNGAGLAVMLGAFAQTGGLTGVEIAVAGGTSVAGQRVLEAVFGDQAVRTLAAQARTDLIKRVRALLVDEAARFEQPLAAAGVVTGEPLRAALAALQRARDTGAR